MEKRQYRPLKSMLLAAMRQAGPQGCNAEQLAQAAGISAHRAATLMSYYISMADVVRLPGGRPSRWALPAEPPEPPRQPVRQDMPNPACRGPRSSFLTLKDQTPTPAVVPDDVRVTTAPPHGHGPYAVPADFKGGELMAEWRARRGEARHA